MYDGAIKLAPGNPVYHMEKAIALHKSERHQEALREIEIAEGLNSDLVLLHFEKGTILLDLKKNQEAIEEFDKGIETDPTNVNSEVLNLIPTSSSISLNSASSADSPAVMCPPTVASSNPGKAMFLLLIWK